MGNLWVSYLLSVAEVRLAKIQENLRKLKRENDEAEEKLVSGDQVVLFFQKLSTILSSVLEELGRKFSDCDPDVQAKVLDELQHIQVDIFSRITGFVGPIAERGLLDLTYKNPLHAKSNGIEEE